jgi:rubredoxin
MSQWECSNCKYILEDDLPPETCPSCKEKCVFLNVTCYTPDCGGPGNIDPQLVKH